MRNLIKIPENQPIFELLLPSFLDSLDNYLAYNDMSIKHCSLEIIKQLVELKPNIKPFILKNSKILGSLFLITSQSNKAHKEAAL
jgi:hypothetical protein